MEQLQFVIEVSSTREVTFSLPKEIPAGRARLFITVVPENEPQDRQLGGLPVLKARTADPDAPLRSGLIRVTELGCVG